MKQMKKLLNMKHDIMLGACANRIHILHLAYYKNEE